MTDSEQYEAARAYIDSTGAYDDSQDRFVPRDGPVINYCACLGCLGRAANAIARSRPRSAGMLHDALGHICHADWIEHHAAMLLNLTHPRS